MARRMVTQYGMSDVLGPQTFGEKEELMFLGREIGEQRNYSEEVAEAIDPEVRRLVEEAHGRAQRHPDHLPGQARPGRPHLDGQGNDRRDGVPGHVCISSSNGRVSKLYSPSRFYEHHVPVSTAFLNRLFPFPCA